jgi:hypothetical protein
MVVWREDGTVRTRAVLDVSGLMLAIPAAVGAAAAFRALTGRHPSARTTIAMGPGGWVSFKDAVTTGKPRRVVGLRRRPALQAPGPRPWWARALRAEHFS